MHNFYAVCEGGHSSMPTLATRLSHLVSAHIPFFNRIIIPELTTSHLTTKHHLKSSHFIAAVGCPDIRLPDSMRKQSHGNTVTVSCYENDLSWQLVCSDNRWVGNYGNCEVGRSTNASSFCLSLNPFSMPD